MLPHIPFSVFLCMALQVSGTIASSSSSSSRNWFQHRWSIARRRQDRSDQIFRRTGPRITLLEEMRRKEYNQLKNDEVAPVAPVPSGKMQSNSIIASETNQHRPSSWASSFLTALLSAIRPTDPIRFIRYAITCGQIGILIVLGHAIYKTIVEMIDEVNVIGSDNQLAFSPVEIQRLLEICDNDVDAAVNIHTHSQLIKYNNNNNSITSLLLTTARRLLLTGLPLRQTDTTTVDISSPSVESILLQLTRTELNLLEQCLWTPPPPQQQQQQGDSNYLWNSIAGLQSVKNSLENLLALLIQGSHRSTLNLPSYQAFSSLFVTASSENQTTHPATILGALLYGPPGCGKTMLVKGLASTSRLPCLVVKPSVLLRKYVGETNNQVRCLFSLANKLSPCIVCIDEMDGLLRERSSYQEHEVNRELKTEFVQWWDGMMSTERRQHPILVIGATNRPFDVDSSVLRRLSQSHFVSLPSTTDRLQLLTILLKNVPTDPDLDLSKIAIQTEGYSPSDLRRVLQSAALSISMEVQPRSLTQEDIQLALDRSTPTPLSTLYQQQMSNFIHSSTTSTFVSSSSLCPIKSDSQSVSVLESGARKWETVHGNFYDVGTLEIEYSMLDTIDEIVKQYMEEFDDTTASSQNNSDDEDNF